MWTNPRKHRVIHLITKTKVKSFKFASVNVKHRVNKSGFPVTMAVNYGAAETPYGIEEVSNYKECFTMEDLDEALQVFVKSFMYEGIEE